LERDTVDVESPGLLIEVECEIEVDICTTWVRFTRDGRIIEGMEKGLIEGYGIGRGSGGWINGHRCTEIAQDCRVCSTSESSVEVVVSGVG
jgi:hypothetical protein